MVMLGNTFEINANLAITNSLVKRISLVELLSTIEKIYAKLGSDATVDGVYDELSALGYQMSHDYYATLDWVMYGLELWTSFFPNSIEEELEYIEKLFAFVDVNYYQMLEIDENEELDTSYLDALSKCFRHELSVDEIYFCFKNGQSVLRSPNSNI